MTPLVLSPENAFFLALNHPKPPQITSSPYAITLHSAAYVLIKGTTGEVATDYSLETD